MPQDHNLLKTVSAEQASRPTGYYRSLILDAVLVVLAFLSGASINARINYDWSIWWAVGGVILFSVAAAMAALAEQGNLRRLVVNGSAAVFFGLPFMFQESGWLTAAIVFGVFLGWGTAKSQAELSNGLRIRFFRAVHPLIGKIITGALLVGVLLILPRVDARPAGIPEEIFSPVFGWAAEAAGAFFPEINFRGDVNTLARDIAQYQTEVKVGRGFRELSPEDQYRVIQPMADQAIESAKTEFKMDLRSTDPVSRVAYKYLGDMLRKLRSALGTWYLGGWAAAVFLVLRTVGVLVVWFSSLAAFFVYQLLLSLNFFNLTGEGATREVVKF